MTDDPADTRTLLIDVAERLFAERGIEAVSLRTVGAEAGQRNNSVAQYHFGSRQGLVDAIIELRSAPIDVRRSELVAAAKESGDPPELATLVRLFVEPLAESLGHTTAPSYYLRFLASAIRQPAVRATWRGHASPTFVRWVNRQLRLALPSLGRADLERRLEWSAMISLQVLAEHEGRQQSGTARRHALDQTVRELVTMQVALLTCPVGL